MTYFRAITTAAALGLLAFAAYAGEQNALDQMRHFAPYQQAVAKVYQDYESSLSTHCAAIDLEPATGHAIIVAPLQIDPQGHITSGIWTERTDGVACGEKRRYAALVVFKDAKPAVYALLPGDSYASPVLQHDAMVQVAGAIGTVGASCPPEVLDTELPNGRPKSEGIAWNEKWIVRSCGKQYAVPMHFVPDATGTNVNISGNEIVNLPASAR